MGYTRNSVGLPTYNSDITDPVGQFQEAVNFADQRGLYRIGTTAQRNAATVRPGTTFYDTDLDIIFSRTAAGAWAATQFPGLVRQWKKGYRADAATGGQTIASRAIPVRAHTQRVHVTVAGSSGFGTADGYTTAVLNWTGAGVVVTSNGESFTSSPTSSGAAQGNRYPAAQFTAMLREFDVEIPANTACTLTVTNDASINAFYRLNVEMRTYGPGETA
jgi:hypothetical protein